MNRSTTASGVRPRLLEDGLEAAQVTFQNQIAGTGPIVRAMREELPRHETLLEGGGS